MTSTAEPGSGKKEARAAALELIRTPSALRLAVVTTLLLPKGGAAPLLSFVRWHLWLGFERIFLYFDDDTNATPVGWAELVSAVEADGFGDRVTMLRRSAVLLGEQERENASWRRFGAFAAEEVQARQVLNAEHAAKRAAELGLRWLVHIDVDELFYADSRLKLEAHFARMEQQGVDQVTYANHEGVPTEDTDGGSDTLGDYFERVSLFRVHHLTVPLSAEAGRCMRWWKARTLRGQFLLCYDNGKSAVRLNSVVTPTSVHGWASTTKPLVKRTALADPRNLQLGELLKDEAPCILHYVGCGRGWLRSKYEILGDFEGSWFGGELPIAPSFHLDARDALKSDDAAFDALYTSHVEAPSQATLEAHAAAGVLRRCSLPTELLSLWSTNFEEHDSKKKETPGPLPRPPARQKDDDNNISNAGAQPPAAYTYEKAWILSQAAQSFL